MPSELEVEQQKRIAKRDSLYFSYRYRKGSYKAKKICLEPILITAKRCGDRIRVYGNPDEVIEPRKLAFAKARFMAWRQKERELRRLAKTNRLASGSQSASLHDGDCWVTLIGTNRARG